MPFTTTPGGKPVTAVPGLRPRLPEMTEGPVLVTVLPASTAKEDVVPMFTAACAAEAAGTAITAPRTKRVAVVVTVRTARDRRRRGRVNMKRLLRLFPGRVELRPHREVLTPLYVRK